MKRIFEIVKNKFTGSKEVKNTTWLIGGRVIQMILSFFVSILTARYLGPSNYGLISYAGAYVAFFTSLCTLGINYVIIKDFVDFPEEQGAAIGTAIAMRVISGFLSIVMIALLVGIVDKDEGLTIKVTLLCSVALIFQVFDTLNYWFQLKFQSKFSAIAALIAYIATSIYRVFLLMMKSNVLWFAFASSIDFIVLAIVLYYYYKRESGPKLSISLTKGKALLKKSYHYILSGMMVAIYAQTDKFMLKQMMDETTVGYYSLAATLNTIWVFVLTAIIDSMYPTIMKSYKTNKAQFEKRNRQLYAIIIYISAITALCFMIFGNLIISIMYGDAYLPAVVPLGIIAWHTIFSYLGVARNVWIVCEDQQKYLKYMYMAAAIINVTLNFCFIPLWGASGAAAASLLTQICTSIILPFFIKGMRPNVRLMVDAFLLKGIK